MQVKPRDNNNKVICHLKVKFADIGLLLLIRMLFNDFLIVISFIAFIVHLYAVCTCLRINLV